VARNKTIKEHYVARQHREAKEAREKGEERATSSIMRLGLVPREEALGGAGAAGDKEEKTPPPKEKQDKE
jgi:NADH dehydrogenase (ubiquinone) Fe-S protein 5